MSARILAVVFRGEEPAALAALPALVAVARGDEGRIRLAYFHALPPARMDRYDRLVADTDQEMARIDRAITGTFARAARHYDDVPIEVVVRFGAPRDEVAVETDVFEPSLVAFCATTGAGPLPRLRAWMARGWIARRDDLRVLVLRTPAWRTSS